MLWLALGAMLPASVRQSGHSLLFLANVFTSYVSNSRFELAALFTPKPSVEERLVPFQEEQVRFTLFSPQQDKVRGGVLLVNGAVVLGNDDPAIRRVASSLARLGIVVGLPEMASLKGLGMDIHDPQRLVAAFEALQAEPSLQNKPVGLIGICFGASLGLLATADRAIADRVAYVAGAIPYARLDTYVVDVLTASTTGTTHTRRWEPREDVQAMLPLALIGLLADEGDQEALRALAETGQLEEGQADLSPAGQALRRLLLARDRAEAQALLDEQHPTLRAALDRLSPLPQMRELRAPLFLFHSESDRVMPWEHSAALAEAAPAGGRLEISRLLHHTHLILDPREWRLMLGYPGEAWDLMGLINEVLARGRL